MPSKRKTYLQLTNRHKARARRHAVDWMLSMTDDDWKVFVNSISTTRSTQSFYFHQIVNHLEGNRRLGEEINDDGRTKVRRLGAGIPLPAMPGESRR